MSLVRRLPLPLRRPLIHGGLQAACVLRGLPRASEADRTASGPLVVSGFFDEALGVGRAGAMTVRALERAGFPVVRHDLRPAFRQAWTGGAAFPVDRPGGVWIVHGNAPETDVAHLAHAPADWRDRRRIGIWAWETTRAPSGWARAAARLHEVWAVSRFARDAFAAAFDAAGRPELKARLRVVPHPAPALSTAAALPPDLNLPAGRVLFLAAFDARSSATRKNPWGAVEAWRRAFPEPSADAALVLKAVSLEADPAAAARLRALAAGRPDLVVVDRRLDAADMDALVARADAVVSLHRAEGFGLLPAEAMSLGKPVVATAFSGNLDFMDADSALLVPARLVPVRDPSGTYPPLGEWAEPDLDAAAEAIRALAASPERRRSLGEAGCRRVACLDEAWSAEALAPSLEGRVA